MCCVYMDDQVTDASFADYLRELGADIDRNQVRRGVLYHVAIPSAFSAERRHQLARVLDLRKDKLARLTAAYSMVTGSQLVKGVLTAIWWLAPPPYPRKVTTSLVTGVEFIAKYMPEVNAVEMARRFQALVKPPDDSLTLDFGRTGSSHLPPRFSRR